MRTLILIRHSKAVSRAEDDHSRELAERGRSDARHLRDWLTAEGFVPDRVVVSTSTRTRQTWELASPGGAAPEYDERVYEAWTSTLREIIEQTPDDVQVLVLVGHNPGIEQLAQELDDSPQAHDRLSQGLPTSSVVVFDLQNWGEPTNAVLRELVVPRG